MITSGPKSDSAGNTGGKHMADAEKVLHRLSAAGPRKEYVEEYIRFIDGLTVRCRSIYWFATRTSAKDHEVYGLFDAIYDRVYKSGGRRDIPAGMTPDFPFLKFAVVTAARIIRTWYRTVVARTLFSKAASDALSKKDIYLIRSWFYPASVDRMNRYTDRFFGVLPEYLRGEKEEVVITGAVFANNYLRVIGRIAGAAGAKPIPQEYFITFLDPIRIFFNILKNRDPIRERVFFMGHDVTDMVRYYTYRDLSGAAFEHLLSFYLIKNISSRVKIKTYLYTFENNPWEKIALEAIKRYSPGTLVIGYQHTAMALSRLGMRIGEFEKKLGPLPDRIVTNGRMMRDILIEYGNLPPGKMVTGCALRFDMDSPRLRPDRAVRPDRKITVLVSLTAFYKSAYAVNAAYRAFRDDCRYRVIVRPHPGLSLRRMRRLLEVDPAALPGNFEISTRPRLEDDILQSDYFLYDQSSTCLNALLAGVPVICVDSADPAFSMDPIFNCMHLKRKAKDAAAVLDAIRYFSGMTDEKFKREQSLGREYAESYLDRLSEEKMAVFL